MEKRKRRFMIQHVAAMLFSVALMGSAVYAAAYEEETYGASEEADTVVIWDNMLSTHRLADRILDEHGGKYATFVFHVHQFGEEWQMDENGHWHTCGLEDCPDKDAMPDYAEHTWDEGEITIPATELEKGEKIYTCTECGATLTEEIAQLAHIHIADREWKRDSKNHWRTCSVAHCPTKEEKLDFAAHTWNGGEVTKESTEIEPGVRTYRCIFCGEARTEEIEKLEHVHTAGREWTIDEEGHWHTCTSEICPDKDEPLDYTSHIWDTGDITKSATETETGIRTYRCIFCGAARTEEIDKLEHVHIAGRELKRDAEGHWRTCTSEICPNADEKLNYDIHTWDGGEITKKMTVAECGEMTYTCIICGAKKAEEIPRMNSTKALVLHLL